MAPDAHLGHVLAVLCGGAHSDGRGGRQLVVVSALSTRT
jgi:hypothetical protein